MYILFHGFYFVVQASVSVTVRKFYN